MRVLRLGFAALSVLLFSGCKIMSPFITVISPWELTVSHMMVIRRGVLEFTSANNRLPSSLDEILPASTVSSLIHDGWDKRIDYSSNSDGIVVLTSFGEDGKPGGSGYDADISAEFWTKNTDGDWITASDGEWLIPPKTEEHLWTMSMQVCDPPELTASQMYKLQFRISSFAHANGRLPSDLSELPLYENELNPAKDGWRRDFRYCGDAQGIVTLVSFGADGIAGGHGENADITGKFKTRTPDGVWFSAADAPWILQP